MAIIRFDSHRMGKAMKECFKCHKSKPLDEFYRHPGMSDGHLNKCMECTKKDVSANYRDNIDHYKEYERNRAALDHRVTARSEYSQTEDGKKSLRKAKAKWSKNNPIKRAANMMVGNAVRDGKLSKPSDCESCGSEPKRLHGHHDDYSLPLVVRWLCSGCHAKWHKDNGSGKNSC